MAPAEDTNADSDSVFVRLCQNADMEQHVTFIGGGNMCQAMIRGFIKSGFLTRKDIYVSTPRPTEALKRLNVNIWTENRTALENNKGGLVILSVKPNMLHKVTCETKDLLRDAGLLVSIVSGVSTDSMRKQLEDWEHDTGMYPPIIRLLPNIPVAVCHGATVFCRDKNTGDSEVDLVRSLLESVGTCHEIPEKQMDAAGVLSACGPAFISTVIEALSDGGVKMGIPRNLATQLAAETVTGAGRSVLESGQHPGELKNAVCSPGGTTIAGIHVLEERGVRGAFMSAIEASTKKCQELLNCQINSS